MILNTIVLKQGVCWFYSCKRRIKVNAIIKMTTRWRQRKEARQCNSITALCCTCDQMIR